MANRHRPVAAAVGVAVLQMADLGTAVGEEADVCPAVGVAVLQGRDEWFAAVDPGTAAAVVDAVGEGVV